MNESLIKAHVVPDIAPKWGGTSVSVPALNCAMHTLDSSVRLYFAAEHVSTAGGASFEGHPKSIPAFIHSSASLRQALMTNHFSIIHHHALWLPSLGYSYAASKHSGCPLVISPHGMLAAYSLSRARFKKWIARHILHPGAMEGATAWRATCEEEFTEIRNAGFRQQIVIIPNGIQVPKWHHAADREQWLSLHPELDGKRILLFFSRLHSKKGVRPLLEMWSDLHRRFSDWHLLLCGTPHEYQVADVTAFVKSLGIEEHTTVADPAGLPKPYALSELFILPTRSENFGLVIGEALSVGVPVLTTTEAPWGKINDLGCGACVPMEQFKSELERLLTYDATTLHRMGQAGSNWVVQEFLWDRVARTMLDFYRSLGVR